MNKENNKIKNLFENWEEQGSAANFNTEKVWKAIQNKSVERRVFIPWYYSVAAAVVFLCFSGAFSYLFFQNNQLRQQFQGNLAQLEEMKAAKPKVIVKKEVQTQYKTQIKEVVKVVKESPKLANEVKKLQNQLAEIQEDRISLQKQLAGVKTQLKAAKDSVKVLKAREVRPFFAENVKTPCQEEMALADIKVNINEKALADLPISKSVEQKKRNRIQIKLVEEKSEKAKKSVPLFSTLNLN